MCLRYVDILAAFDNEQNSWNFLHFLNNRHPNIKFTVSLKIPSPTNSLIANDIRSVILEIKNDRCKIVKTLIFCSLSREHFQSKWKLLENVLGKERNISILKILHLSFLISNMTPLILLITIKFTIERQINHSIVFLQVFTSGINNQNLRLQTYHKSTHTGLLLNFKSLTSFSYKISLIKCLIDRSLKL